MEREREEAARLLAGARFEAARDVGFFLLPDRLGVRRVAVTVGPTLVVGRPRSVEGSSVEVARAGRRARYPAALEQVEAHPDGVGL